MVFICTLTKTEFLLLITLCVCVWGMVSEHLQTKEREARNSKDRGGRMSGGKQS